MFNKIIESAAIKRAYRQLFCESGHLTPDGKIVLADLYKHAKLFQTGIADRDSLQYQAGQRDTVEHIIKMLKIADSEITRRLEMELEDYE